MKQQKQVQPPQVFERRSPEGMFAAMRRHPYLLMIVLCGLLLPFGLGERTTITAKNCLHLGIILGVTAVAAVFYYKLGKSPIEKLILSGVSVLCITACMLIINKAENKAFVIPIIALIIAVGAVIFIRLNFELDDAKIIAVLILLGLAIRFTYVLYTGINDRQHDVGNFTSTVGHAGYIGYWYQQPRFKLPDFDVSKYWQYYHPPFHHWLMAILLSVLTELDVPYMQAGEAIQILPMLYSCLTMIVCYKIFRLIKLSGYPLIAATAIVCFHPTFIIYAGSYNNDMLLMLFMMAAIMWGIRWYRDPTYRNIIPLALCVGLGMMTKLSGWMVAPAIAFLFLVVLIKHIKKPLQYLGQYVLFGLICVPMGLWWQVRNLLLFKMPLTFVPDLQTNSGMYALRDHTLKECLFSFGNGQLDFVYGSITFAGIDAPYNEYNPTVGLFKTAMFDECSNSINNIHYPQITTTGPILFWISVVFFLLCFGCFIYSMIRKDKKDGVSGFERIYFALLFVVILASYYWFCIKYPQSCTFNARYVMPLIPLCAMGMGLVLRRTEDNKNAVILWLRRGMYALAGAFCVMSYLVYTQVGATMAPLVV